MLLSVRLTDSSRLLASPAFFAASWSSRSTFSFTGSAVAEPDCGAAAAFAPAFGPAAAAEAGSAANFTGRVPALTGLPGVFAGPRANAPAAPWGPDFRLTAGGADASGSAISAEPAFGQAILGAAVFHAFFCDSAGPAAGLPVTGAPPTFVSFCRPTRSVSEPAAMASVAVSPAVSRLSARTGMGQRQTRLKDARDACAWDLLKTRTLQAVVRGELATVLRDNGAEFNK
ncbi:hypothetical protein SAVIM338S_04631 [Streptomyces avidinii]